MLGLRLEQSIHCLLIVYGQFLFTCAGLCGRIAVGRVVAVRPECFSGVSSSVSWRVSPVSGRRSRSLVSIGCGVWSRMAGNGELDQL